MPKEFPFEIIDNPGDQIIILKRVYGGETIKATIFADYEDDEILDDEDEEDEEEDDEGRPGLSVIVTVEKGEGPFLEFVCKFNEEGYEVESMLLRKGNKIDENAYNGPEFA